jgi:MoaA/NifB/PqqE/SkfB family radical SAM enzyme
MFILNSGNIGMRYKTEIDNVSKFCVAPFMSLNVDPDGSVKSCCMQDPQHIGVKYSDHDNMHSLFADSEFNNLRTMMRQNIEHPSCTTCYRNEDSGIESERQIRNRDYIRNYENIKITDTSIPTMLDLRLSNKCNLKCRMCNEIASSQIAKEKFIDPAITEVSSELIIEHLKDIKELRLLGGEPSLTPQCFDVLTKLIECDNTDINIAITTNATSAKQSWFDLIKHFPNVKWQFSIDSVGKINDYIRTNSVYSKLKDTIKRYRIIGKDYPNWEYTISQTVQIYNLTSYFKLSDDLGDLVDNCDTVSPLSWPDKLNIKNLPWSIRQKYINLPHHDTIRIILSQPENDPVTTYELMTEFIKYTEHLDLIRGTSFSDIDSELWNDIRNYVTDNYVTLGDYLKNNSMRGE